ncbi:hypothetical protein B0H13DRAFT_2347868 [Mycena leptocephala]|nr:hypothetical protein B0H13DRAFT_2347868 [Mycena leptocephala]
MRVARLLVDQQDDRDEGVAFNSSLHAESWSDLAWSDSSVGGSPCVPLPSRCHASGLRKSDFGPTQSPSRRSINEQVSLRHALSSAPSPEPTFVSSNVLTAPPALSRALTERYRWTTLLHCMCTNGRIGAGGSLKTSAAVCKKRARGIDDGVSELRSFVHLDPHLFCLSRDFTGPLCFLRPLIPPLYLSAPQVSRYPPGLDEAPAFHAQKRRAQRRRTKTYRGTTLLHCMDGPTGGESDERESALRKGTPGGGMRKAVDHRYGTEVSIFIPALACPSSESPIPFHLPILPSLHPLARRSSSPLPPRYPSNLHIPSSCAAHAVARLSPLIYTRFPVFPSSCSVSPSKRDPSSTAGEVHDDDDDVEVWMPGVRDSPLVLSLFSS